MPSETVYFNKENYAKLTQRINEDQTTFGQIVNEALDKFFAAEVLE